MDVGDALRRYLSDPLDYDEAEPLIEAAENAPSETWTVLRDSLPHSISPDTLARLAVEVVDTCRIYGGQSLWAEMVQDDNATPPAKRAVSAVRRYIAKNKVLSALLHGTRASLPEAVATDLPLPNVYETDSPALSTEKVAIPDPVAFINHSRDAWEQLQTLIGTDPERGWNFCLDVIARASEVDIAWVAAAALEPLITHHESQFADRIIDALSDERFRSALKSCYLNPSEPFLDRLIAKLAQPSPGA